VVRFLFNPSTVLVLILIFSNLSLVNAESTSKIFLEKIRFHEENEGLEFKLAFTKKIEYITYRLDSPSSLIIDVLGNDIFTKEPQSYRINSNGIGNVKVMHFGENSPQNPIDLIIFEFDDPGLSYSVEKVNNTDLKLIVSKKDFNKAEFKKEEIILTSPTNTKPKASNKYIKDDTNKKVTIKGPIVKKTISNTVSNIVEPIDYDPDVVNKNVFVVDGRKDGWQLWFENTLVDYQPLQIAQEQVNLADIRVRSEKRNLFPMMKIQGSETKGTTGIGENEYEERRYGLEVEQPLTFGGELRYKLRRALVNLDIAKKEYNRIRADYLFRVKEVYFKLLLPKIDLVIYSGLLKDAREHANLIRTQYEKGLVPKDEYLRVESTLDQIYYQVKSTVEDFEVAKVNFKQVLNLDMDTDIEAHPSLVLENIFIDQVECLKVALKKRPELEINQLVVDFNQFNREIAKAKEKFKVSLSGFLGRKGSAYITEPFIMEDEWSLGLKISKLFGTNTATTSLTTQTAPPSLSQAGAEADTNRAAFELSLMDKMNILTEGKSAHIEYMKSVNELAQIRDTISSDIKTSYANYKKSLYQIKSAKEQINKQIERLSILRFRWKAGQANLSDVLEAELRLTNQKSSYNRGLISYYIALSNLSKACGVDSFTDLYDIGAIAKLSPKDDVTVSGGFSGEDSFKLEDSRFKGYIMALGSDSESKFVIVNLGRFDGAKKGMDLTVHQDGSYLGDIRVIGLRNNSSSCLVNERISGKIKLGDTVRITSQAY